MRNIDITGVMPEPAVMNSTEGTIGWRMHEAKLQLRRALDGDELLLYYQPQIELHAVGQARVGAQDGQHVAHPRLELPLLVPDLSCLLPALLHGHDELLLLGREARLSRQRVLQV